jgi:hypothetical protein
MTLGELLDRIDDIPRNLTVYVPNGEAVGPATRVALLSSAEVGHIPPAGLAYLLEVDLIKEVLEVWSVWRGGRLPQLGDKIEAVVHYAEYDAYLPAD